MVGSQYQYWTPQDNNLEKQNPLHYILFGL